LTWRASTKLVNLHGNPGFNVMSASKNQRPALPGSHNGDGRVTTIISCPGVRPMARNEARATPTGGANENNWFDDKGFKRRWYANIAAFMLTMMMLYGGVWIVGEFVRLQKLEACFEAGRRDCMPLDFNRTQKAPA
jgi:hypothetical protein